ncbi:hypothetical protein, partial [Vibrio cholerae]|uniref:hypothetical protein n=1 Tax=Vibrio cholerae TaxID=666 RepID=UPI0018F0DCCF
YGGDRSRNNDSRFAPIAISGEDGDADERNLLFASADVMNESGMKKKKKKHKKKAWNGGGESDQKRKRGDSDENNDSNTKKYKQYF